MRAHIFPVKLWNLMQTVSETPAFKERLHQLPLPVSDGLDRIPMFSPEIHAATPDIVPKVFAPETLRKRLCFPHGLNKIQFGELVDSTYFEVYTIGGEPICRVPVVKLKGYLSVAVEVELMHMIMASYDDHIPLV